MWASVHPAAWRNDTLKESFFHLENSFVLLMLTTFCVRIKKIGYFTVYESWLGLICIPFSSPNFSYWSSPVCVVYKSQAPGICPEKDLDRNGVWVRVLILFSSTLLQAMAVLMQWQGSLKLWLYETKANFLSFVHYRERLPAGRKACCANYSIHESSLKYVMDFTELFTGEQGDMVYVLLGLCTVNMLVYTDYTF